MSGLSFQQIHFEPTVSLSPGLAVPPVGYAGVNAGVPSQGLSVPAKRNGNIFTNLLGELKDLGPQTAAGVGMLLHDAVTSPSQLGTDLGTIAHTTVTDIKDRWSPLFMGDLSKFWHQTEQDPLGLILDASALVTGGGSLAGKLGTRSIKALGESAPEWAKSATGLQRIGHLDELTADGKPFAGLTDAHLEAMGKVVDAHKGVWEPQHIQLELAHPDAELGGRKLQDVELSTNPIVRWRQIKGVELANKAPNAPIIGSHARAKRTIDRKAALSAQNLGESGLIEARGALEGMTDQERLAMGHANTVNQFRATGMSGEEGLAAARSFYQRNLDDLKAGKIDPYHAALKAGEDPELLGLSPADEAKQAAHGVQRELVEQRLEARLKDIANPDITALVLNPTPKMQEAMAALNKMSSATTKILYDAGKVGWRKPIEGEAGHPKTGLVRMSFEDTFKHQQMREARMMLNPEVGISKRLRGGLSADEQAVADYEDWVKQSEEHLNDDALKQVYVRPHIKRADVHQMEEAKRPHPLSNPTTPRGKHNKGYNLSEAADLLQPEGVQIAFHQAINYQYRVKKLESMMNFMRTHNANLPTPKNWVKVQGTSVDHLLKDARNWLDNDAKAIFGNDPELEQVRNLLTTMSEKAGHPGGLIMPERIWNDLEAEFRGVNLFIQRYYDRPMRFWKQATLAARPVWITGNLFGAFTTLLTTHGLIRGTASYMQALRMASAGHLLHGATEGSALIDQLAPAMSAGGFFRSHLRDLRDSVLNVDEPLALSGDPLTAAERTKQLGKGGIHKLGNTIDKMAEFNARLTDDIPRRAAMWAEIRPMIAKLESRGMTRDEAIRSLLSEPRVVDRLVEKVLGDLVDFRTMTRVEREYFRRIVPFYAWTRGITGRVFRLGLDEPWKVWQMNELSHFGKKRSEEYFGGSLPSFMQGAFPVPFGSSEGHQRVINTNSLNPFQTPSDIMGMLSGLLAGDVSVGGNNPASQISPLLKSPIEAMMNRDAFYGTPLQPGAQKLERQMGIRSEGDTNPVSMLGLLGMQLARSFPQERYVEKALPTPGLPLAGSTLYQPSALDQLLSYFLIPTKQLDVGEAQQRAKAEATGMGVSLY